MAFFMKCLQLVAMGGAPMARLLAAFTVADKAKESCRKPGAVCTATWMSWQPAPLPSSIAYYQTPSPAPAPALPPPPGDVSGPTAAPMAREAEIKELRDILMNKQSPFQKLAEMHLKELNRPGD